MCLILDMVCKGGRFFNLFTAGIFGALWFVIFLQTQKLSNIINQLIRIHVYADKELETETDSDRE